MGERFSPQRFAGTDNDAGAHGLLALGGPPSRRSGVEGRSLLGTIPELYRRTPCCCLAWLIYDVVRIAPLIPSPPPPSPPPSPPLHPLFIAAGSPVNALDARNRTAPAPAVRACTSSYWKYRRKLDLRLQHCSPRELPPSASIFPQAATLSMIYCVFKKRPFLDDPTVGLYHVSTSDSRSIHSENYRWISTGQVFQMSAQ